MYPELPRQVLKATWSSDWIKEAIEKLDRRDVVDVLTELETLQTIFMEKFEYMREAVQANKELLRSIKVA